MFYSIRVGEEPDSILLKNREIRTKSRWYGSTPPLAFLRQRSYHFRSNWSYIYFSMKKIWLSMFYSIRVGEEPDSILLKNREIRTKSRWYGSTPPLAFLRQRSYHFRSNWSYIYFSISIQEFLCVSTPLRDPEKMDKLLFLGTHIRYHKKDNGNPTINYFNLIVIKIHALPRQNL